ncbi:uroporphyrinogen-III synthase [Laribacter hongkongensis]|uniref:uroporphyrinogen-III synthase n=1 Tax=Laribacter hongkongensis TaxID=168471 RepID=UPI001EFDCE49|nr:uroporphyrinogen-III synthase [Laribacter hongkongensis]MCG9083427.1 uroporphyrinogen-III synthase [Laribacter hongkongensis]
MSAPLVIITRPHEAGAPLAAALRTAGFAPFEWPLLALEPEPEALDRLPAALAGADWLVVVSPSAARLIAPALARLPAGLRLAAVGRATAQVLEQASGRPVLHPATGNDSEALLALPDWGALDGRTVVIAKGRGGRPWLAENLARRGARVVPLALYRRRKLMPDPTALQAALAVHPQAAVLVTSTEIAEAWRQAAGDALWPSLQSIMHIAPHPRIAERLTALGVMRVKTTGAGDDAVIDALTDWFLRHD